MSSRDDAPLFRRVDWQETAAAETDRPPERTVLLVGSAALAALVAYDTTVAGATLVAGWDPVPVDWLVLAATVVLTSYGLVPALRRPTATRRLLARLRDRRAAALSGVGLGALLAVGLLGPAVVPTPDLRFEYALNPPLGFSSGVTPARCLGDVSGPILSQRCHGSLAAPLGTNQRGFPMSYLLVTGARTAASVLLVTAALVVPVAAAVGVLAGLRGGIVDTLLSGYVDVQTSIPAVVVYVLGYAYFGPSLLLLLVAFGLFSWGGIARLVRGETIQRRLDGHVVYARSLGASPWYLARRHVLPNVTNTLVPAAFHLLALLVLVEAGIAFLGFHQLELYSWGATISESLVAEVAAFEQQRAEVAAYRIWWVSGVPALALTATMLALKLLGDGLRDALDPRGER
jgi:peptide/nickel transport system permease protein